MRKYKITFFFLLSSLIAFQTKGQVSDFSFEIFGFEEGLSHRNVTKIQQDTLGFIWLATVNGLNKYDGYHFTHYRAESVSKKIATNYINDLLITDHNQIQLSHPNQISYLNGNERSLDVLNLNGTFKRGQELTAHHLSTSRFGTFALVLDQVQGENNLVFISRKQEIQELQKLSGRYSKPPILIQDDTLYLAEKDNLVQKFTITASPETNGVNLKFAGEIALRSNAKTQIVDLQITTSGELFALTENGKLYHKNKNQATLRPHPLTKSSYRKRGISTLFKDREDNIWLGGRGVLYQWNYASGELIDLNQKVQQSTKYAPNYRQIFQDRSGVIWIATDLGAIKVSRSDQLFKTYLNDGNEFCTSGFCSIRGMAEDDAGNIYFSYYNSIHKLEKTTGVLMPLFPENNYHNPPFGLAYCQDALWTGNGKRIDLKNLAIDSIFTARNDDKGVVIATNNHLWFGYENSLVQYFPEKKIKIDFTVLDSANVEITYLHKGQTSGDLWIGTEAHGVLRMNSRGKILQHLQVGNQEYPLRSNRILSIYENEKAQIWLATAEGAHLLDFAQKTQKHFSTETGLSNNFINAIQAEGDSIVWLSTDNGLCRLHPLTQKVDNFYRKDGLPANEFNRVSSLSARDGRLFFGGMNGLVAFYPGSEFVAQKEEKKSNLLLTSFSKFDGISDSLIHFSSGIRADSMLELSWRDKFFTFNFALADFNNPDENKYSYLLEGYDEEWSEKTRLNSARYNNLPAGEYTLRVRAAAGTDDWNTQELRLPIKIDEAFYKKNYFIILSILLAGGLVYGIMRYRLHLIRQREKLLEKQVRERTHELEKEKQVSDNLLLNILPAETAEELKKYGSTKAKRYEQVTVFFSDFKDFTKISAMLEPEQLVAEIDFCFRGFDEIIEKYGLEKIKTIGDAYMCTAGMSGDHRAAAINMVNAALEIQDFMQKHAIQLQQENRPTFEARIGLHTGAVVAGIVGSKKFAYDIWGDTVNIASRMESHGEVEKVNISQTTYELVKDHFVCQHRGKLEVKNKGEVDMYFVE